MDPHATKWLIWETKPAILLYHSVIVFEFCACHLCCSVGARAKAVNNVYGMWGVGMI